MLIAAENSTQGVILNWNLTDNSISMLNFGTVMMARTLNFIDIDQVFVSVLNDTTNFELRYSKIDLGALSMSWQKGIASTGIDEYDSAKIDVNDDKTFIYAGFLFDKT